MQIAVLGTGNMGRAILNGLHISKNDVSLIAYDTVPAACADLSKEIMVVPPERWFLNNKRPDAIVMAVKPADMREACKKISSLTGHNSSNIPLLISIAAGICLHTLQGYSGKNVRFCRVMSNIPAKIGQGMSAYSCCDTCTEEDRSLVEMIFSACGKVLEVQEKMLHAVTGLSGSGPAYTFLFIESLIEGGVTAGLSYSVARECAIQTVLGATLMVRQSSEHTAVHKAAVMSPGGTTAAGLHALEKNALKSAVIDAVYAATIRSEQLGV